MSTVEYRDEINYGRTEHIAWVTGTATCRSVYKQHNAENDGDS